MNTVNTLTNAMLVYGYHLGSGTGGWQLHGTSGYDQLRSLDWHNPEEGDFRADAEKRLLNVIAGFTEEWTSGNEGYSERELAAKARLGVEIESHCTIDYPMYLLIAKGITAHRGDVEVIDFEQLAAEVRQADADTHLRTALDALGIRPLQERPQWLLCSYWA